MTGRILVLSGPSGCGKSTLVAEILANIRDIYFSISATTRAPREGEIDGKHYYFVSEEEFRADIEGGNLLEWTYVHNNLYGTPLKPIENALKANKLVLFDVDVQGQANIKKHFGKRAVSVFIATKNREILRERLIGRNSDDVGEIEMRLSQANNQMQALKTFDYLIINDDLESSKRAILSIATSLESAIFAQDLDTFMQNW